MSGGASLNIWPAITAILLAIGCTAFGGRIIYVDIDANGANDGSSWTDAYRFLQDALVDANDSAKPVEIRVAQGIYTPDQGFWQRSGDSRAYFRLISEVAVKGGFAGLGEADPNARNVELYKTILSGDLEGNDTHVNDPADMIGDPNRADNCRNVVGCSNTDATAALDGVTITGGHSTMVLIEGLAGGGGMIIYSGSPTLIDCVFTGNFANQAGGGIRNSGGSPTLINCTISKNRCGRGGGMFNYDKASPTLINCIFHNNTSNSHGAGMYNHNCSPRLTNCKFSENSANYGGGIYNVISKPVLSNCTFIRNRGKSYGGGICNWHECSPRITDCVFNENSSNSGGAVYNNRNSHPTLTNCIFSRNFSDSEGGAIYNLDKCNPTITNCIISSNQARLAGGAIYNSNSNPIINNCDFRGNYGGSAGGGIHNRNSNPILTNCVFTGNSATDRIGFSYMKASGGGMGNYENSHPILGNCTFAGNLGDKGNALACNSWLQKGPSIIEITDCIFRDGEDEISNDDNSTIIINYSNIQGGWPGETNIDVDPLFVNPGYWDPNSTPDDPNDDFWIDGDYHLKSQAGRWDPKSGSWACTESGAGWVKDDVTSPCIDAGDPGSPIGQEPFPNGGIINMGAYGGTAEASKSYFGKPVCETIVAGDINGDCKVDYKDFVLLATHWLEDSNP